MKQIREACLIGVFLLVSSCGLWAASVTLEPFESATGIRVVGQNNGAGSFTLSSENAKAGNYALKFDYNLPPGDYGFSNVGIFSNWHLPAADGKLGFWAYGNANRNQIILRIEDFSGEVFQYYLGYSSDCDEEWKWFEKDLASYDVKWGGNGNGVIDAPAKVQCIMVGGGLMFQVRSILTN